MKALVIYDSQYGNTERGVGAIGEALAPCAVMRASEVTSEQLTGLDVLVVGSPTQLSTPPSPVLEGGVDDEQGSGNVRQ